MTEKLRHFWNWLITSHKETVEPYKSHVIVIILIKKIHFKHIFTFSWKLWSCRFKTCWAYCAQLMCRTLMSRTSRWPNPQYLLFRHSYWNHWDFDFIQKTYSSKCLIPVCKSYRFWMLGGVVWTRTYVCLKSISSIPKN